MAGDGKPTQRITDFDALYRQAEQSQPLYAATMNEYLAQLKARHPGVLDNVQFEQGPLKSRDRALAKINGDYDGEPERIADLVRGRFVVHTAQQVEILRRDLLQHPPFTVERLKDQFAEPTDTLFRAENAQIRLSNGHLAELRVEHEGMLEAAIDTHKPYEVIQEIKRRVVEENRLLTPKEQNLLNQKYDEIGTILDRAAREGNLDPLLNEKGRAEVEAFRTRVGTSVIVTPKFQSATQQVEINPPQNLAGLATSHGERDTPSSPARIPKPTIPAPSEQVPERIPLSTKIGVNGTIVSVVVGTAYDAGLAAANDGNARDIAHAGLHGLANSALPGVTDGFKNITENNQHQNRLDQILNAGTTATQGVAVGALAVAGGATVAAPVTGGTSLTVTAGSLVVAGFAGVANLGIGVVHDLTYLAHASKQGGVVTGLINMAEQLADSKAAHRTFDWVMGNDAKVQHEIAVKGIRPNQLRAVDENHDGKITAQETRDYLIQHHVAAEQVNSLPAKELADKLASVMMPAPHAASKSTGNQPVHPSLSPDMMRALGAAFNSGLSSSILCDPHHNAQHPHAPMAVPQHQPGIGVCR